MPSLSRCPVCSSALQSVSTAHSVTCGTTIRYDVLITQKLTGSKSGFHSNARKALRKEKYIKSAHETQQKQENYASKKQTQAQVTQLMQAVLAQENATIE